MQRFCLAIIACLTLSSNQAQLPDLDSLLNVYPGQADSMKVQTLTEIARYYIITGQPEACREYANQSIALASEIGNQMWLGRGHYYLSKLDTVHWVDEQESKTAIEILQPLNDRYLSHIYLDLGRLYETQSRFAEAVELYNKAINHYRSFNDTLQVARIISQKGYAYDRMGDYELAIAQQEEAINIFQQLNERSEVAYSYGLIGIAYDELANYDLANKFNERALQMFREEGNEDYECTWLSNLANTALKTKDYKTAESYLNECMALYNKMGMRPTSVSRINLAHLYLETGRYVKARDILEEAMALAVKDEELLFQSEAQFRFHQLEKKLGNYEKALLHHVRYKKLTDSIFNIDKTKQIAQIETRFGLKEQQAENEILAKENQLIASQKEQSDNRFWASITAFVLMSIIGLLLYNRSKNKQREALAARLAKEKEIKLQEVILATENERKRIAKDLHDGIVQQLGGLKLGLSRKFDSDDSDEARDLIALLDTSTQDLREISHRMMPRALSALGLVPALKDMLDKSLGMTEISYSFEDFGIKGRFNESLEIGLYRICQEIVNNIIKHSKATEVTIQLMQQKGRLILIAEDNGIGMNQSRPSDGIGLRNISSRVDSVNGAVDFSPSLNQGTLVTVNVPLP